MQPWLARNPSSTKSTARQAGYLDEQFTLLNAQSASVHERRRTFRERRRKQLAELADLVIPHALERVGGGGFHSRGSSEDEEPRSRFSDSLPPSPKGIHSPGLPASPPPPPIKRRSMLARLMKVFVP